jgi:hypothetical protein
MTLTLRQYIKVDELPAFEAVGWRVAGNFDQTSKAYYADLIIERDMDETELPRMSVVSANSLDCGEIEVIAVVDRKQQSWIMTRHVAAQLIAAMAKALSE